MIYLDTHAVVWLYAGFQSKFSQTVKNLMNEQEIMISPIVRLELQYFYEIHRVTDEANTIVEDLSKRIGLKVCDEDLNTIVNKALESSWIRDPFDRLIVANAGLHDSLLVSKDEGILRHYPLARW